MNFFIYNGKMTSDTEPVIGPDNRGLRYGDGLFETLKLKNGQLIFWEAHFDRLVKGLGILQFEILPHFTSVFLQDEILSLVRKNRHEKSARIRINIFRGNGGLYDQQNNHPQYIIQSWSLSETYDEWNSNGLVLGIYKEARKSCDALSNLKHNNFLPYIMAALQAKKEKWNDAVVLNTSGHVADATIANIFLVKDQAIYTPALTEGCIAGIMRKILIQYLQASGTPVTETTITVQDLLEADEVFLTNSLYNFRWVQSIENKQYKQQFAQEISIDFRRTIL